jgi:hypothetical protein
MTTVTAESTESGSVDARLPLLVGVTGHRDLRPQDIATLAAEIRRIFDELRAAYPHTPVVVISSLAEGADRLVARVALDLGLRLVVPLPLEPADYRQDFGDAASAAEFDALCARAERTFVVRSASGAVLSRPDAYRLVGHYVARQCHVLVALWNGGRPNKVGGTDQIVRYRLEGAEPGFKESSRLVDVNTGLVYQIVTPRESDQRVDDTPIQRRVLAPTRFSRAVEAERSFRRTCQLTDAFNQMAASGDAGVRARRAKSASHLLPSASGMPLPGSISAIRALYGCADEAAIRFQRQTRLALVTLLGLAGGVGIALTVFTGAGTLLPQWTDVASLLAYLALFGVGIAVWRWRKSRQIDERYLDYRALAEGLRVEFYWRVAGVSAVAADRAAAYRPAEMEWIRLALRACEVLTPPFQTDGPHTATVLPAVVTDWVRGQDEHFRRASRIDRRQLQRLKRVIAILVIVGVVAAAATVLALTHAIGASAWNVGRHGAPLIGLAIGVPSIAAGLVHGFAEQRALAVHIKRDERLHLLFAAALRLVEPPMRSGDWNTVRDVLIELGREALDENGGWAMLHRESPMEPPA